MSDETNLADLLALNLHNFEEEVLCMLHKALYNVHEIFTCTLHVGS